MRRILTLSLFFALPLCAQTNVTLLHFSDYHSHALPFYTDDGERGGIARAIGYLRAQKRAGALVFSGGDMVNKGAPAWSDKYECAEWPWFNGIVSAMAFGNHDADYGRAAFDKCKAAVKYPILSANTNGFPAHAVFKVNGVRIGVFAVAGSDFTKLVKEPGFTFSDPVAAAREQVRALRNDEHADAVVMIGHNEEEADYALAQAVPGIDLIFGTHSHLRRDLVQIPGTNTAFISPSQYLTFISRVQLTIEKGRVTDVKGGLIPVDAALNEDRAIAARVAKMQAELEKDPQYAELFTTIGNLDAPISTDALGARTLDVMRNVAHADAAISTKTSFRSPLPRGPLSMELLRAAMPYDNEIVVATLTGAQLRKVLEETSAESYVFAPAEIDPAKTYRVATTDYMAFVAFNELFGTEKTRSGLRVRDELRKSGLRF